MPELTVSMPAYNTGKYIGQAIESVLRQQDIDFELVVVDDGSTDNTLDVVRSFEDPRIRLIGNARKMGIGRCHNLVVERSDSPFIAHVDSDDVVLAGALRKLVEPLKRDPGVAHTHCYFYDIDAEGRASLDAMRERWRRFHGRRPPDMDYRVEILRGCVINHLRTYRREHLAAVGAFSENLRYDVDYDMSLRLLDRYSIRVVPEFLYCFRIHQTNTTESLRFKLLRFWWVRNRVWRQILKSDKNHFIQKRRPELARISADLLFRALGLDRAYAGARKLFGARVPAAEDETPIELPAEFRATSQPGIVQVVLE